MLYQLSYGPLYSPFSQRTPPPGTRTNWFVDLRCPRAGSAILANAAAKREILSGIGGPAARAGISSRWAPCARRAHAARPHGRRAQPGLMGCARARSLCLRSLGSLRSLRSLRPGLVPAGFCVRWLNFGFGFRFRLRFGVVADDRLGQ